MTSDFTGSVVAGQFEASKRIGKGHFGSVYLCKNKILGYNSAVKIIPISGKNKDSAAIEAKLLAISQHGHIVNVRSASFWDDGIGNNYFIIEMEYVDGGSLEDAIKLNVSIGDVLSTIKNVLFAIAHVHSDVVHRDIKPANILMGGGGIDRFWNRNGRVYRRYGEWTEL